jgi:TolB-like protein
MSIPVPCAAPVSSGLSEEAIEYQVERIFTHPDFSNSAVLKKFLRFVVHETLIGNANLLKEYTIALEVLEKPFTFNPQKNCIVRIHAGRLRRALSHYYTEMSKDDEIIIDIPKGKYIPVFLNRQQWLDDKKYQRTRSDPNGMQAYIEPATFAILPFLPGSDSKMVRSFSDNLCWQLCTTLSQLKQISVISYQVIKNLAPMHNDLKALGALLGFNHFISGATQYVNHTLRLHIQITDCRSFRQIWSQVFEYKMTASNLFNLQDEICQVITGQAGALINEV